LWDGALATTASGRVRARRRRTLPVIPVAKSLEENNVIVCSTVHQAKGLEWDIVILVAQKTKEKIGRPVSIARLLEDVSEIFEIEQERLYWRSRQNSVSKARAVCCYAAVRELSISGRNIGRTLNMTTSAVTQAVQRGAIILQKQPEIQKNLERVLLNY